MDTNDILVSLPSTNSSRDLSANPDIVEVSEIRDLLEYNSPQSFTTSAVLNYCQRKMILPYTRLLGLLGLRPLLGDLSDQSLTFSAINKIHLFLVTCFLIFGFVMQFFTCFRRDLGFSYIINPAHTLATEYKNGIECEGSLFLCYILPPLLHLSAFIHTIYLLRVNDNEHLQTLFEKVFLLTSRSGGALTQRVLLRRLRAHVILSVVWLLLALVTQLFLVSSSTPRLISFLPPMSRTVQYSLIGAMVASTFCQDVVHCLVVSNYCIECQLLTSYVMAISERVIEKSLPLEVAMKELLEYEKFLSYLNQQVSAATFIFFALSTTRSVVAAWVVLEPGFLYYYTIDAHSIVMVMLLVQWVTISTVPLISAAYVTSASRSVNQMGPKIRVRPFGFQETPPQHLDSFMMFMGTHKGAATLCWFPISGALLGAVTAIAILTFLISSHLPR